MLTCGAMNAREPVPRTVAPESTWIAVPLRAAPKFNCVPLELAKSRTLLAVRGDDVSSRPPVSMMAPDPMTIPFES